MWKYLLCSIAFLFTTGSSLPIEINGHILEVEVADTLEARNLGLSGRSELPEGTGMLFVFRHPHRLSFWMKNTLVPLSIGFFDANRVLIQTEKMNPSVQGTRKLPTYTSKSPALYAIEVSQGWFDRHHIQPGAIFNFIKKASTDQTNSIR
jgi:uncharacterized membrane protein (UPF0127 family)